MGIVQPIAEQQQDPRQWQRIDDNIQKFLRILVDPMQIIENQDHRLAQAFSTYQRGHTVKDQSPARGGIARGPFTVEIRHPEQRQISRLGGLQFKVSAQHFLNRRVRN